jgi:glycine cleavage system H protein
MTNPAHPDRRYTALHEWLEPLDDGGFAVGITDHGQSLMGDLVFVEAPPAGRTIVAGEACGVLESVKAAADLHAPVSGTVIEINRAVVDRPELLNEAADTTWIFRMRPTALDLDRAQLLDAAAYAASIGA